MGLFGAIKKRIQAKALSALGVPINSQEGLKILGTIVKSGVSVNETTAMSVSAVYACVRILSESIASLPVKVYRDEDSGRVEAKDSPAWDMLKRQPNEWQTPFEWKEMSAAILALRGNAYSYVSRDPGGRPIELIPLAPEKVGVMKLPNGQPIYSYEGQKFSNTEVLHLKGLTRDGYIGISPISALADTFGMSIAGRDYAANTFGNDGTPGGVLESPVQLDKKQIEQLRDEWDKKHQGVNNARRPAILYGGMKWNSVSMAPKDAQLIESRKFEVEEIARIYRVPLNLLQSTEKSTSWGSGIEQQNIGFVEYTLRPWLVRIEEALNRVLLSEAEKRSGHYIEFNLDALLRGDFQTRMNGYKIGVEGGIYTVNEVRQRENLPRLPGDVGDVTYRPSNTVPAESMQRTGQNNE